MIPFSGSETFPSPLAVVAARLSDAAFLAACAPDATVRSATPDAAEWTATARLGFTTATLDSTLAITGRQPGEAVAFTLTNRTAGATLGVATTLRFAAVGPAETRVDWSAEVTGRTGLLKLVPASMIRSQIESLLGELWQSVRAKLNDPAAG